jgi:hypothetical protein
VPLVVCCRSEEYQALGTRLGLRTAVEVQPLTDEQVEAALAHGGESVAGLRAAMETDPELRQLVTTPLMLSIVTLTYQGQPSSALPQATERAARRQAVFRDYVRRMLGRRRSSRVLYPAEQAVRWLSWQGMQMEARSQTDFYLERLQPDWLPDERARARYRWGVRLLFGLPVSLVGGLLCGLAGGFVVGGITSTTYPSRVWHNGLASGLLIGIGVALLLSIFTMIRGGFWIGLVMGALFGACSLPIFLFAFIEAGISASRPVLLGYLGLLEIVGIFFGVTLGPTIGRLRSGTRDLIQPAESVYWSWRGGVRGLLFGFGVGALLALLIGPVGYLYQLSDGQTLPEVLHRGLTFGIVLGLPLGVMLGLAGGLLFGLSQRQVDEHDLQRPNEGISRSLRNSLRLFLLVGLPGGLIFALFVGLIDAMLTLFGQSGYRPDQLPAALAGGTRAALYLGLPFGVSLGLFVGLLAGLRGLHAYLQHRVLRHELGRTGTVPPRYERFLDFATDHVLLQRVGGGYRFIHALLLDYFAELYVDGARDIPA